MAIAYKLYGLAVEEIIIVEKECWLRMNAVVGCGRTAPFELMLYYPYIGIIHYYANGIAFEICFWRDGCVMGCTVRVVMQSKQCINRKATSTNRVAFWCAFFVPVNGAN
jgi:hypothetical protein